MQAPLRAVSSLPAGAAPAPFDRVVLVSDQRRVRRRLLPLAGGGEVLVDFAEPVTLEDGGALVLDDGRHVEVVAGSEPLFEIAGRDDAHVAELAWHIGNRHTPVEVMNTADGTRRLLIRRDQVLRTMLIGLGATLTETKGPFSPLHGAYHDHGHALLNR